MSVLFLKLRAGRGSSVWSMPSSGRFTYGGKGSGSHFTGVWVGTGPICILIVCNRLIVLLLR